MTKQEFAGKLSQLCRECGYYLVATFDEEIEVREIPSFEGLEYVTINQEDNERVIIQDNWSH